MILLPCLITFSCFLITLAIRHLNQSVVNYYDFVALIMVAGGTLALGAALLPWEYREDLKTCLRFLFRAEKRQYPQLMRECVKTLESGKLDAKEKPQWFYQRILADGFELIQLGIPKEKVEMILRDRVYHSTRRWKKIAASVRNLAKYPPAFGLMGTVFGLVNIMRGLAQASDPGKLGVEMSVALVATMYGLLMANFVVNPIGEILVKKAEEEEEYAIVAVEAILMVKEQAPLLESVEVLNSLIPEDQRYRLNESMFLEDVA
jgi:chemotaxis protein MotA